jgi:hypothetical protein
MKTISLSQNKVALVDDEDFERLSSRKWYAAKERYTFYAVRTVKRNGKNTTIRMHREVLRLSKDDGVVVDHRDMNGLNNQKENIRKADKTINNLNKRLQKNNSSGFRGVSWHKGNRKWGAHIRVEGKLKGLGFYSEAAEAAIAYNKASIKYYGENAFINQLDLLIWVRKEKP